MFQSVANYGFRIAVILKIYKIALPVILAHEDHYTRIIQAFLGNNTFADTVNVVSKKLVRPEVLVPPVQG